MTKTAFSLVCRVVTLAILFGISTTITFAAPFRFHQSQPRGMNWGRPVPQQYLVPGMSPAYSNYPLTAPSAPPASITGGTDYMAAITTQGTFHWQADKLPIKVWISSGEGVPSYRPQFRTFIRNGFDEWCRISGNKLAWVEVNDQAEADITVKWTNQVTERPEGTEAGKTDALTRFNRSTGRGIIYGARMQFLTRMPDREFTDLEVAKTCMHEVGHAIGLQGHSPHPGDIMYYAVKATKEPTLSDRDVNTLTRLYSGYPVMDAVALSGKQPAQP
jgi:predicted Zn-dependent protease